MRSRTVLVVLGLLALAFGLGVYTGRAGSLDPPSGPMDAASQMFTLDDIYNVLNDGTGAYKMAFFREPASGPGTGSMHTLDEIMDIAPLADNKKGALPGDVLSGKTYWGLRSDAAWGPQTGTAALYSAGVPKTGQTECYKSQGPWAACTCGSENCPSGQDGDLEKGVPWPDPRFTDNGDGTVTDNLTGLVWLQDADCWGKETWAQALAAATGAGPWFCASPAGIVANDWRLPNIQELQSLIDHSQSYPALPPNHPFADVQNHLYWSSTTDAESTWEAYRVSLATGGQFKAMKTDTNTAHVWPVRGGQ